MQIKICKNTKKICIFLIFFFVKTGFFDQKKRKKEKPTIQGARRVKVEKEKRVKNGA